MITRREALCQLGSVSAGAWIATRNGSKLLVAARAAADRQKHDVPPPLAPGSPNSAQRIALIDAFKERSEGIDKKFEARSYKSDWVMPYRLFRPAATGKIPLVLYLHGSGGLGDDNQKQMGLGNIFGTRLWALPENQKNFPCYVVVPQTDRGWVRYTPPSPDDKVDAQAKMIPGLGDGARVALEIIAALRREFAIDDRRIYVTGQSMGGSGTWHMTAQRPHFFAAAVAVCGGDTLEDAAASLSTPLWNFHGDVDQNVPVALSRDRIAALRKAGGHPLYTEYAGVAHNVWEWAYTEPELVKWVFAQRRA